MKISAVITELASTIVGAQKGLDRHAQRDSCLWHEHFDGQETPEWLDSIMESLKGNLMRVSEVTVQSELSLEQRSNRDIDIGLSVFAQPVHSFYHSRFRETRTACSQLEMVCIAAPVQPQEQQKTQLDIDERTKK
jgi:hypothetical protein